MKRSIVFIDGSNFYFRMKDLMLNLPAGLSLLDFGTRKFAEWLVTPDSLVEVRYYIGAIKRQNNNSKSETMYANQQKLFYRLQQQNVQIILGQLIQHPDKTYHEKGVDVRIAVEMIRLAIADRYDQAYLISSDTDLVPAVEEVKALGKRVQYVGCAKGQSFGLSKVCNDVRLLRSEDINPFFPATLI